MGYLHPEPLRALAGRVLLTLQTSVELPASATAGGATTDGLSDVQLDVALPMAFDAVRIAVRTIMTRVSEKVGPFPAFSELIYRLLGRILKETSDMTLAEESVAINKVCYAVLCYAMLGGSVLYIAAGNSVV
jgi:hypothetical protein